MGRVDEELARAVERSEAEQSVRDSDPPVVRAAETVGAPSKRNVGLLVALLAMVAGVLFLVFTSFDGAAVYSKGVDELLAERSKLATRKVRVEGTLVKGSLKRRDEPCEYRFRMERNGSELAVRYPQCVVPDTFRDVPGVDVAVTAEGRLSPKGHFEADQIMAKCPSKYESKNRARGGTKAPNDRMTRPVVSPDRR